MIISTDGEKAYDKLQHPSIIKPLGEQSLEGSYLNEIKGIYEKPAANSVLNGERWSAFLLSMEQCKDVSSQNIYS